MLACATAHVDRAGVRMRDKRSLRAMLHQNDILHNLSVGSGPVKFICVGIWGFGNCLNVSAVSAGNCVNCGVNLGPTVWISLQSRNYRLHKTE